MVSAICSTGRMIDRERTPSPRLPATAAVLSLDAAIQHGGWGSWKGLGVTIRYGTLSMAGKSQYLPWKEKYSDSHACTTAWIASTGLGLALDRRPRRTRSAPSGWTARCPTRPGRCSSTSAVATFSATRTGEVNSCGMSTTPKPSRIRSVTCGQGADQDLGCRRVRAALPEVVLHVPGRVKAHLVGQPDLSLMASR